MIVFPNVKINLGLKVCEKRADGFHNIETVFYPLELCDILEAVNDDEETFLFNSSGREIPGDSEKNLCAKAFRIIAKDFNIKNVKMFLHKIIPIGAGLGGGSSDGAFALKLLNELFGLNLSYVQLLEYACKMGNDCSFFIKNSPVFAKGRGDDFTPVSLNLKGYRIVVVHPNVHINTGWAYGELGKAHIKTPKSNTTLIPVHDAVCQPVNKWSEILFNDFEEVIFEHFPEVGKVKDLMYKTGALYASMSGSGSAVYGIFEPCISPNQPVHFLKDSLKDYFVWQGLL